MNSNMKKLIGLIVSSIILESGRFLAKMAKERILK